MCVDNADIVTEFTLFGCYSVLKTSPKMTQSPVPIQVLEKSEGYYWETKDPAQTFAFAESGHYYIYCTQFYVMYANFF